MTKQIALDGQVKVPEEVVFEKVGEDVVLLHLGSGVYYGLGPVGSRIWELLVASGSPRDVLGRMVEEYDVAPETLQQDMGRLLQELQEQNLITFETSS